ncbi:MAG: hypothetical protein M0R46_01505 [Candidatus Muirbacterium halophilum]|nr:hypothetical protein [Candidatus Muirbacterium halophilum]MCK9474571.1 hypothetical protein [Candidatus Muirbacterium halophilum]
MKYFFVIFIFFVLFNYSYCDLIFYDKDFVFSIPEQFFREQLYKNRELYSRAGLKDLDFRRNKDKLIIVGNYGIFPFRIYFSILKKSLDIYIIKIDDFMFFNMVRYSKRKLVSKVVNSLSQSREIAEYFKIEADNVNIVIKLKKTLSQIFPAEFKKKPVKE